MVRKPINRTQRQEIHYCHKCRKSTKHSEKVCGRCSTVQREFFQFKPKEELDEVPMRLIGGSEPTLWGKKKVYDRRKVGLIAVRRDVEQVKVEYVDGSLVWINLNSEGTL